MAVPAVVAPVPPIVGAVLIVGYRREPAMARTAFMMWSVTTCGWEIMITCEPSTSMMSFTGNLLRCGNAGSRRARPGGRHGIHARLRDVGLHVQDRGRPTSTCTTHGRAITPVTTLAGTLVCRGRPAR